MRENYFRDFRDATLVQNLFKQIRATNRTNSRPIWTPTCEDIDHIAKIPPNIPPKKNPHMFISKTRGGKLSQNSEISKNKGGKLAQIPVIV